MVPYLYRLIFLKRNSWILVVRFFSTAVTCFFRKFTMPSDSPLFARILWADIAFSIIWMKSSGICSMQGYCPLLRNDLLLSIWKASWNNRNVIFTRSTAPSMFFIRNRTRFRQPCTKTARAFNREIPASCTMTARISSLKSKRKGIAVSTVVQKNIVRIPLFRWGSFWMEREYLLLLPCLKATRMNSPHWFH